MMFVRYGLLAIIGFTGGFVIAAGLVAFITVIGVLTRLAIRTNTASRIMMYEDVVVLGAGIGNIVILFELNLPFGIIGMIIFGGFAGSFVGCLAVALEEVIQVFPIFAQRIKLKFGIPFIVFCLALGKGVGALLHLYMKYK
ncbi:hypothetical protein acsn021_37190 [Anaerocolumna cellulosilytica]|uniref:Uncharacterized protein n=1 Tax=Anaerocolumna cellulosilytica TaxID=433286 RepID=A0A6S6R9L3_9FIRM|nr:stage V sporulation protein AB [Anaerocolumna cellulosilytica]MBB5195013.1 stage V sporulation protein AB [Anaerocolumna cellulosilytica]BCJ96150.1 hypothetical protein acsn021_37190 [Anaerocolumna cellulosilytica]